MDAVIAFACYVGIVVGGIVSLKVFFSLWGVAERKLYPDKIENALETSFKALRKKVVVVKLRNGETLEDHIYTKTLYYDVTEFGSANPIYFHLTDPDGRDIYVAGSEIISIACAS